MPADWTGMVLPHPRQNAVRMKHVLAEKRRELRPRSHLVVTHGTALGEIRERHDVHHIFDCLCRARRGRRGLGVINAHGVEVKRHDNILHLAAFTRRTQRAAGGGLLFRRRPVKIMRSKALDKLIGRKSAGSRDSADTAGASGPPDAVVRCCENLANLNSDPVPKNELCTADAPEELGDVRLARLRSTPAGDLWRRGSLGFGFPTEGDVLCEVRAGRGVGPPDGSPSP
eukprot:CAMPEP_0175860214 /NCGR_PEP_ID=MMETSP0107_2-20121207/30692_1 /TAXON_ID=195067 ORGANISM="Goniomonas pacifica, Strain CCMP1869" /NCGR_SAMPLE_ID=MMETSP0107_2 /ASSEMBLY_ACC=CAM_ASM_000203 /LENGTH=227 /DNA_ID=CAMNT_0017176931 /DNA_START=261 /DNA_END=945 /DNA_ORIENTATION=-